MKNILTSIALIFAVGCGVSGLIQEIKPNQASAQIQDSTPLGNNSRLHKLSIQVIKPDDLKIKQGDSINVGQIIADRTDERQQLLVQQNQIELSIKQIESRKIIEPNKPKNVPEMATLPEANFVVEEAAINEASRNLDKVKRSFDFNNRAKDYNNVSEKNAVETAKIKLESHQKLIESQQQKIIAIKSLKDINSSVLEHESKKLESLQQEKSILESNLKQAESSLAAAVISISQQTDNLNSEILKAEAALELSKAKLEKAKSDRKQLEYQHSINLARRIEESNQAESFYSRQLQETENQKRDKEFQLAQLRSKLDETKVKLSALSTVRSPYSGTVRRIKWGKQNNNVLDVDITIVVGNIPQGSSTESFTDSTINPLSPSGRN